jgi:hypothetical protein
MGSPGAVRPPLSEAFPYLTGDTRKRIDEFLHSVQACANRRCTTAQINSIQTAFNNLRELIKHDLDDERKSAQVKSDTAQKTGRGLFFSELQQIYGQDSAVYKSLTDIIQKAESGGLSQEDARALGNALRNLADSRRNNTDGKSSATGSTGAAGRIEFVSEMRKAIPERTAVYNSVKAIVEKAESGTLSSEDAGKLSEALKSSSPPAGKELLPYPFYLFTHAIAVFLGFGLLPLVQYWRARRETLADMEEDSSELADLRKKWINALDAIQTLEKEKTELKSEKEKLDGHVADLDNLIKALAQLPSEPDKHTSGDPFSSKVSPERVSPLRIAYPNPDEVVRTIAQILARHAQTSELPDGDSTLDELNTVLQTARDKGLRLSTWDETFMAPEHTLNWYFLRADIPGDRDTFTYVFAAPGRPRARRFDEFFDGFEAAERDSRVKATVQPAKLLFAGTGSFSVKQRGVLQVG